MYSAMKQTNNDVMGHLIAENLKAQNRERERRVSPIKLQADKEKRVF
jgi:hypothetical protein